MDLNVDPATVRAVLTRGGWLPVTGYDDDGLATWGGGHVAWADVSGVSNRQPWLVIREGGPDDPRAAQGGHD